MSSLIQNIPFLINPQSLDPEIQSYQELLLNQQGGFAATIIERIALWLGNNPWNLPFLGPKAAKNFQIVMSIVPIDLFFFFLSTMLFGIVGFFSKFLNKEPLNRPILVLFAAYILCGIAFQIFGYVITKYPWTFPDQNAYFAIQDIVDLDNPTEAALLARLFIPAITFDKIFMALFMIYQLFFNKNLRYTVNEIAITQAVADKDNKTLQKYTHNKNPQTRKLVLEAVGHICEEYPDEIDEFLPVIQELAVDHDPQVIRAISPAIKTIGFRTSVENLVPIIQLAFGTEQNASISEMQKVLIELGRSNPEKIQSLYGYLYDGYLPDKAKDAMVSVLHTLGDIFPELSYNIASPLLDKKTLRIRQGAMQIIKNLIHDFKPKFRALYDKMKEIANNRKDPLRGAAIESMGYICSVNEELVEEFLADYKEFIGLKEEDLRQVVGGLTQIIISFPEYIDKVFPSIATEFTNFHPELKGEYYYEFGGHRNAHITGILPRKYS